MRHASLLSGLLGACALLLTPPAAAQNPAAAEALFEQARAAMAAGSFDIACARFRDSDRLDPAVGTRFNLADCEERRGRVATAWSLFRGVLSELAEDDDRKPIAEARAAKLKPRLPMLTLVPTPESSGQRVRVDGVELGEGSFSVPLPMDPGSHELSLVPAEGEPRSMRFVLREGERTDLPLRIDAAAAAAEPEAPPSPDSDVTLRERRKWGYVAGSVGLAGVVTGVVAGVVTLSKKSSADENCSDATRTCNATGRAANESGKTFGTLSGVGFGVGVVGLAAGAYLILTSKPQGLAAHSSIPSAAGAPQATRTSMFAKLRPDFEVDEAGGLVTVAGRF